MAPVVTEIREGYQLIPITALIPSPTNPRKHFPQSELDELAASIREHGVLQPLVARPHKKKEDHYEIVCGERRFRGAQLAGRNSLPVMVRVLADADVLEIQLIENVQRNNLEPLEEAKGYRALIDSNPAKYSAGFIADRIGRSEKFVWDRMKLLDLVAPAKQLLERGKMLVGHAELLAKLKPEDQLRAIAANDSVNDFTPGGLFEKATTLLDDDDAVERAEKKDPYARLKPVAVEEFKRWIAKNVRFDVEHAAAAAPLDFGAVAVQVNTAAAKPGRGKKVIAITFGSYIAPDARADSERTFGPRSFKLADGSKKSQYTDSGRYVDAPTCEHSVLGVVAVGRDYGKTFDVCIARDKCEAHWKKEIAEKKENEQLRASGKGAKAAKNEQRAADKWKEQQRKQEEQRKREAAEYRLFYPLVVEALKAKLPDKFDRTAFEYFYDGKAPNVPPAKFVEVLVLQDVEGKKPTDYGTSYRRADLTKIAKHFGVDVKKIEQQIAADAKSDKKTEPKKAPAKAAKKAKAKK